MFINYRSLGTKRRKYSHKSWDIRNKRKIAKENRERIKHDMDIRRQSAKKPRSSINNLDETNILRPMPIFIKKKGGDLID